MMLPCAMMSAWSGEALGFVYKNGVLSGIGAFFFGNTKRCFIGISSHDFEDSAPYRCTANSPPEAVKLSRFNSYSLVQTCYEPPLPSSNLRRARWNHRPSPGKWLYRPRRCFPMTSTHQLLQVHLPSSCESLSLRLRRSRLGDGLHGRSTRRGVCS